MLWSDKLNSYFIVRCAVSVLYDVLRLSREKEETNDNRYYIKYPISYRLILVFPAMYDVNNRSSGVDRLSNIIKIK